MAQVTAQLNKLRIAPRKVRLLADLIRGKHVLKARWLLDFSVKRGSLPLKKLLDSAVANAKHNFQLDEKNLYIAVITVDEGTKMRRWRARSRGRANRIEKKTSQIKITLKTGQALKANWQVATKKDGIVKKVASNQLSPKPKKTGSVKDAAKLNKPSAGSKIFRRKSI